MLDRASLTHQVSRTHSLPRRRGGHTTAVSIGGEEFCLTANAAADGTLGEIFIRWGKHGTPAAGLLDLYAGALSMALRHQVPLADLIRSGLGLRFVPAGRTNDPDIPRAGSIADYVSRRLALDWLSPAERAGLGIHTPAERPGGTDGQLRVDQSRMVNLKLTAWQNSPSPWTTSSLT